MNIKTRIWDRVSKTDPAYTKNIKIGAREFTEIDAQYQIKRATEVFGPVGCGWGYESKYGVEHLGVSGVIAWADITLWYKEDDGEMRLFGPLRASKVLCNSKGRVDEDAWKKALTDGVKKMLSHLGFSADVFLGMYDEIHYVEQMKTEIFKKQVDKYIDDIRRAVTEDDDLGGKQLVDEVRGDRKLLRTIWAEMTDEEKTVIEKWVNNKKEAA